jgi:hypothetical protein
MGWVVGWAVGMSPDGPFLFSDIEKFGVVELVQRHAVNVDIPGSSPGSPAIISL